MAALAEAIDFVASMPGSKSEYSGTRRAQPGSLDAGLDEFLDMRRHEVQPAEILRAGPFANADGSIRPPTPNRSR